MSIKTPIAMARRKLLTFLSKRPAILKTDGPTISFTFDDFPRTALTVGGNILEALGSRGTYYTSIGLMNSTNHLGEQFRRDDLETLLYRGHELASHTFSHISCRSVSCAKFRAEVDSGRRALEEITGQSDIGNFAFPFGDITLKAKTKIGMDVASSRGIWGGFNDSKIDLNLLRANSLYGGLDKSSQVRELILENERRQSWLIFYSHDVRDTPSPFGCTPELLKFAVSFALSRSARVATVAEVVAKLVAPSSTKEITAH
ncbi:polysaccharide deacetylase family protein [Tunturiibacter lichenicola]|jgi:peptidoglycan/xylan/chitin deacetylase (PgdA/CDA1 family)|uniref:polysaccharide deacetylase family protein n=1 Tax=Tunturiibacter lichenicola TaxID=2051959 RepID=UPI003D9ABF94